MDHRIPGGQSPGVSPVSVHFVNNVLAAAASYIGVYLRLEQARFPGRIEVELPAVSELPATPVGAGDVQAPLSEALSRWMAQHTGQVRVALRGRGDALDLQLDRPDAPGEAGERLRIPWGLETAGSTA